MIWAGLNIKMLMLMFKNNNYMCFYHTRIKGYMAKSTSISQIIYTICSNQRDSKYAKDDITSFTVTLNLFDLWIFRITGFELERFNCIGSTKIFTFCSQCTHIKQEVPIVLTPTFM